MIKLWFEMFWINIGYSPPLSWKMGSHCLMSICMQSIWILPRSSLCPRSCLRLLLSAVSGRMHVLALNKKWNMKKKMTTTKFGGGKKRGILVMNIWCLYLKEKRKFSTPSIVSEILFLHLLRVVYPNLEHYSIEKAEGVSEAGFKGICKRKTPLPFAIPSTGKHVNKAGSTLHLD